MFTLYLIAIVPAIIGLIIYMFNKKIAFTEFIVITLIGFLFSFVIHMVTLSSMTADTETLSGKVVTAKYEPRWVERYTETHTSTDSNGRTRTWTTTHYRTHGPDWTVYMSFKKDSTNKNNNLSSVSISQSRYNELLSLFGKEEKKRGYRSGMVSGDAHDYYVINITGYIYPVTDSKYFKNKVKACPSVFSYSKVATNIKVFAYPKADTFNHMRLLGIAKKDFDLREFNLMNTRLGPEKKVNVIICGFTNADSSMGDYQESKWIGGKKNDLVICYGDSFVDASWDKGGARVSHYETKWVRVFGWTESANVKRNLESQLLVAKDDKGAWLPIIEKEIRANYVIKDWSKFDYLTVEPPPWSYWTLVIIILLLYIGGYIYSFKNDFNKED
jgi:hypothetical protein